MYLHIKNYELRYTDVDYCDNLKLSSLLSIMEESACLSAEELGFGYSVLQPKNIGFIIVNWYIELFRSIRLGDILTVKTWPVPPKRLIVFRDYELFVNDEKVGVATSRWCLVDLKTFRLLPSSVAFDENMRYNDFRSVDGVNLKIPELSDGEHRYSKKIAYSDYDHYNHVNNTKYADFLMDAFSVEELESKWIKSVRITYVKQSKFGETIAVYKKMQDDGSRIVEGRVNGELRVQMSLVLGNAKD